MWHRVDKEKQTRTTKIEKLGTKAIATIFVLTIKFQSLRLGNVNNFHGQDESDKTSRKWLFDKNEFDWTRRKSSRLYNSQTKLDIQNWFYFPKGEVVGAPKLKAPGTVAWAN